MEWLNIANNCRACQIKTQEESQIFIFATTNLPDIYQETTSLDIYENDGLPRVLCSTCYGRLLEAYNFRKMCSAAVLHFQQILSMEVPEEKYTPPELLSDPLMVTKTDDSDASNGPPEKKYSPPDRSYSPLETDDKSLIEEKPLEVLKTEPDAEAPLTTRTTKKTHRRKKSSGVNKKKKTSLPEGKLNMECSHCNSKFRRKLRLEMHMREKHLGLKPCQCKICGKGFGRISSLRGHMGTQHGEKRKYPCPDPKCKKQYDTEENLNCHVKKWHDPENPRLPAPTIERVCEVCGKSFKTSTDLVRHSYSHGVRKPYGCKLCPTRFPTPNKLRLHMMRHEGIKNFECTVCGLRKVTAKELKIHMNTHTREITYSCEFCPHETINIVSMRRHVKVVHQGVKDFHCPHCERSFGKPETLKHHVMTHTGEKPHACNQCGKRFIQQTALKTHMKTHLKSK
ncbi:zinc finger protein 77-like [Phlebotomus papatasi]|uniref:zinc finger protein 77-like n=1 Tax=Phlebotomus papatasi TaxID=29031 RepID=UPI00248373E2|nr:zinc finger protein 77-like [Phlebotomus papatasi]